MSQKFLTSAVLRTSRARQSLYMLSWNARARMLAQTMQFKVVAPPGLWLFWSCWKLLQACVSLPHPNGGVRQVNCNDKAGQVHSVQVHVCPVTHKHHELGSRTGRSQHVMIPRLRHLIGKQNLASG
eukprot:5453701-Amphidinium_carterae.1